MGSEGHEESVDTGVFRDATPDELKEEIFKNQGINENNEKEEQIDAGDNPKVEVGLLNKLKKFKDGMVRKFTDPKGDIQPSENPQATLDPQAGPDSPETAAEEDKAAEAADAAAAPGPDEDEDKRSEASFGTASEESFGTAISEDFNSTQVRGEKIRIEIIENQTNFNKIWQTNDVKFDPNSSQGGKGKKPWDSIGGKFTDGFAAASQSRSMGLRQQSEPKRNVAATVGLPSTAPGRLKQFYDLISQFPNGKEINESRKARNFERTHEILQRMLNDRTLSKKEKEKVTEAKKLLPTVEQAKSIDQNVENVRNELLSMNGRYNKVTEFDKTFDKIRGNLYWGESSRVKTIIDEFNTNFTPDKPEYYKLTLFDNEIEVFRGSTIKDTINILSEKLDFENFSYPDQIKNKLSTFGNFNNRIEFLNYKRENAKTLQSSVIKYDLKIIETNFKAAGVQVTQNQFEKVLLKINEAVTNCETKDVLYKEFIAKSKKFEEYLNGIMSGGGSEVCSRVKESEANEVTQRTREISEKAHAFKVSNFIKRAVDLGDRYDVMDGSDKIILDKLFDERQKQDNLLLTWKALQRLNRLKTEQRKSLKLTEEYDKSLGEYATVLEKFEDQKKEEFRQTILQIRNDLLSKKSKLAPFISEGDLEDLNTPIPRIREDSYDIMKNYLEVMERIKVTAEKAAEAARAAEEAAKVAEAEKAARQEAEAAEAARAAEEAARAAEEAAKAAEAEKAARQEAEAARAAEEAAKAAEAEKAARQEAEAAEAARAAEEAARAAEAEKAARQEAEAARAAEEAAKAAEAEKAARQEAEAAILSPASNRTDRNLGFHEVGIQEISRQFWKNMDAAAATAPEAEDKMYKELKNKLLDKCQKNKDQFTLYVLNPTDDQYKKIEEIVNDLNAEEACQIGGGQRGISPKIFEGGKYIDLKLSEKQIGTLENVGFYNAIKFLRYKYLTKESDLDLEIRLYADFLFTTILSVFLQAFRKDKLAIGSFVDQICSMALYWRYKNPKVLLLPYYVIFV